MTTRWAVGVWAAALIAVLVHQWLEPFTAGSQMGMFTNGGDLDIYRHGGLQVLHGGSLYDEPIPPGGWFTYPPFASLAFIPLSLLSFPVARVVWMLVSFLALVGVVWRCADVLGYRTDARLAVVSLGAAVIAIDIEAVRGTLWQGQVNLVLMAIVVWDLTRVRGARSRGWAVGVAAGIKLTAIVFIPYLLITRQWRAAATAAVTLALTVSFTWAVLPGDSAQYWFRAVFQTDRIGPLTHPGNYSIGGILATLSAPAPMPTVWWLVAITIAAAIGYLAAQRAEVVGQGLLAVTIVGLLSCTAPPLAWGHHWVWTVPLLVVLVDRAARHSGPVRIGWMAAVALTYVVVFMWFNAWLYRTALRLGDGYPTYVDALDAAIDHMSRFDKLIVVGLHPSLFLVVAVGTIATTRTATGSGVPPTGRGVSNP